jgi:CRISPR type III-B/RAMP module RAMP protein Cmr1
MKRSVFKLQFLTPAFIAGADPKSSDGIQATAELRAASVRGQLRWWHRFLGYDEASEGRIYGVIAGDRGHASRVLVRIVDAPAAVQQPQTAQEVVKAPKAQEQEKWGRYMVFNLRNKKDARSCFPEKTSFGVLLQTRDLSHEDEKKLMHTMEVFSWLGALGSRSRRCFGALTLLSMDGNPCQRPGSWAGLLQTPRVGVSTNRFGSPGWIHFLGKTGKWLSDKRAEYRKKKNLYLGSAGSNSRQASQVLLRPDLVGGKWNLLVIGPTTLLKEIGLTPDVETIPPMGSH